MPVKKNEWAVCTAGRGRIVENGVAERRERNFPQNSVGLVEAAADGGIIVWLIGRNEKWLVPAADIKKVDVLQTGDKHLQKICNICHRLLPVESFARNQNNVHGIVRRPSCIKCRTDIDKRAPKSGQAKQMERRRPKKGAPFKCPICQKRSIAGITAKIVADHDHHTGNIRDFICDSCNTGLGRFKNGNDYLQNAIDYLNERDELNTARPEKNK